MSEKEILVTEQVAENTEHTAEETQAPKMYSQDEVDAIVGKVCIVTEEIRNIDEVGEVKLGGLHWSARAEDPDRVIAVGEQVTVLQIQGVKLIVK